MLMNKTYLAIKNKLLKSVRSYIVSFTVYAERWYMNIGSINSFQQSKFSNEALDKNCYLKCTPKPKTYLFKPQANILLSLFTFAIPIRTSGQKN